MIHIAIGTKAQFIKMAPVMQVLQKRDVEYNLIDLGQHSLITNDLRKEFGLKSPDVYLSKGENISGIGSGIGWMLRQFSKGMNGRWLKQKVFKGQKGVCLIHGDTVSTLVALFLAKRAGIKTAHIEAGLRSFNSFEPFPEEILRVICMKYADMLFAPSTWAYDNLTRMGLKYKSLLISGNTSLETTRYSLDKQADPAIDLDSYAVVTVHRMENIFSRKRLSMVMDLIEQISQSHPVVFVQHPPTIAQLRKFRMAGRLAEIRNIHYFKILSHAHFISFIRNAEFVVTDGGSIQEESYYLDVPCLLLRKCTERMEGVGGNVCISKMSASRIKDFVHNYSSYHRDHPLPSDSSPSEEIVDLIMRFEKEGAIGMKS